MDVQAAVTGQGEERGFEDLAERDDHEDMEIEAPEPFEEVGAVHRGGFFHAAAAGLSELRHGRRAGAAVAAGGPVRLRSDARDLDGGIVEKALKHGDAFPTGPQEIHADGGVLLQGPKFLVIPGSARG